jgi:hypothetical protein
LATQAGGGFPSGGAAQAFHGVVVGNFSPVIEVCNARIHFVGKRSVLVLSGADEIVEHGLRIPLTRIRQRGHTLLKFGR